VPKRALWRPLGKERRNKAIKIAPMVFKRLNSCLYFGFAPSRILALISEPASPLKTNITLKILLSVDVNPKGRKSKS
jgi:hypothetical protein